ncbi:MAG: aminomethyltransferase family protein, partial [Kiloniellaceae bacterium]
LTVTRLAENHFYIVTGSGFGVHDAHWIESHLTEDAFLIEVTSGRAVINLCGPKARQVLEQVAEEDVSNEVFPFATARQITIGAAPVLAVRIGYVGELGWELHVPTEFGAHVYETLRAAGEVHGIRDVGYRAIESLRLEKGYVYWSADVTPDYSPYEAGLGFRVHLKSKGDFIGRAVLEKQKAGGVARRLCTFTVEEAMPVFGGETILKDGKVVGLVSSGGFGTTIGKTVLYGYLPQDLAAESDFDVEAFGAHYRAARVAGPLYDPDNERLKA